MNERERLEELIVRQLDGELTADEQRELAVELEESAEARKLLASYMRLEGAAIQIANAGLDSPETQIEDKVEPLSNANENPAAAEKREKTLRITYLFAAVACLALIGAAFTAIVSSGEMRPSIAAQVEITNAASAARKRPTVGSASAGTGSPGSGRACREDVALVIVNLSRA